MDGKRVTMFGSFMVVLLFALISGCATMGDVMRAKDEGTAKVYPVNADQAWEIAKTVPKVIC
jgi:uncharacterized protein YceK